jgi:hypothetical protein
MKYDHSHPDAPDIWSVIVPDYLPQKGDKMICLDACGFDLTVGKEYLNIGWSAMGDRLNVFDDNNKMILANLQCFIKPEFLNIKQ